MFRRIASMRWRIASAYLLLLAVTLTLLALVSVQLLRATYLRTLQDGVAGQACVLATLVASEQIPLTDTAQLNALVHTASIQLGARVTIASRVGVELADSLDVGVGTSILNRPEVHDALQQGQGANERFSAATGTRSGCILPPSAPQGALRVGVPLAVIAQAQAQLTIVRSSLGS